MIRVEIEGRDQALEFPDGTPQEVIQQKVNEIVGNQPAAPAVSPERAQPKTTRPQSLRELTGGLVTREAALMIGGLGGGAVAGAAATAPTVGLGTLPAIAAGGALGTAASSLIFDSVEDMLRTFGVLAGRNPTVFERSETALKEGAIDLATAGVAPFIRPVLAARALLGKISGVTTKAAQDIAVRARGNFGINLGALDVGGAIPKGFAKLVGIFPYTGAPQRKAMEAKLGQAGVAIDKILNEIAPNATLGSALSINMTRAAENTFLEFRTTAGRLYDAFRGLAKDATVKEIIPTDSIRVFAREIADDIKSARIRKRGTTDAPGLVGELETAQLSGEGGKFISRPADSVGDYINGLRELPELINMEQYRGLVSDLKSLIDKGKFEGFDIKRVVQAKEALEFDLNAIRTDLLPDGAEGEAIKSALEAANLFYSKGILQFQTTASKPFARVEKNIFTSGGKVPGSLNADEVERIAVNLKSPQAIQDLRQLVGDDLINQAARKRVEDAAEIATETIEISGISTASKAASAAVRNASTRALSESTRALIFAQVIRLSAPVVPSSGGGESSYPLITGLVNGSAKLFLRYLAAAPAAREKFN